ncbi:MAG: polyketide cyclase, partial [Gemmatimonadetes bacterium]|nr:polyketide cyclase [Gemmatimonadota bacterium]
MSISRLPIDAPRERVFEAWTKQLPQWWEPHGMTT